MKTIYGLGYTLKNKSHIYLYMGGWNGNDDVIPILLVKEDGKIFLYNKPASLEEAKNWIINTQLEATRKGYPEHDQARVNYLCEELETKINNAPLLSKSLTKKTIVDSLESDFS